MDGNSVGLYAGAGGLLLFMLGAFLYALLSGSSSDGDGDAFGLCGPVRFATLTARPITTRRRIIAELASPAGWRDTFTVPAPTPAWYDDDIESEPVPVAAPSLPAPEPAAPIPVEWPTRIVQPVPLSRR